MDTLYSACLDTLYSACVRGDAAMVAAEITVGVDVNGLFLGFTPLYAACSRGHTKVAQMLMRAGAAAGKRVTTGGTPRSVALQRGHHETAEMIQRHSDWVAAGGSADSDGPWARCGRPTRPPGVAGPSTCSQPSTWARTAVRADPVAAAEARSVPIDLETLAGERYRVEGFVQPYYNSFKDQVAAEHPELAEASAGRWGLLLPGADNVVDTVTPDDVFSGRCELSEPWMLVWLDEEEAQQRDGSAGEPDDAGAGAVTHAG